MKIERRDLQQHYGVDSEIRTHEAEDGGARLGGLGIPVDQWSDDLGGFRERILPGAFTTSIENDDIRAIFNHDSNFVLGRKSAGTLRFDETERGVFYEVDVPDTTWARDLMESIKRRDIRENSFGFMTLADHFEERDGTLWRTVKEAELRELGPQVFPAYPQSSVDVRSIADIVCHGKECVKRSRGRSVKELERELDNRVFDVVVSGQNPDLLARELELDRRLRGAPHLPPPRVQATPKPERAYPDPWDLRFILERSEGQRVRAIAYHEAAHAVVFFLEGTRLEEVLVNWTKKGGEWRCVGGACDLKDYHNLPAHGYAAGDIGEEMAGLAGVVPADWSNKDQRNSQRSFYSVAHDKRLAREVLGLNWKAVRALAAELVQRPTISGSEAEAIILDNIDPMARDRIRRAA